MSEGDFSFESEEKENEPSDQVSEIKYSNSKIDTKKDSEEKIILLMSKAKKVRTFHKKKL